MTAIVLQQMNTRDSGFRSAFEGLLERGQSIDAGVEATVREIIDDVRRRGDVALLEYTKRFDRHEPASVSMLEIPRARLNEARRTIPEDTRVALESAAARIESYHAHQRVESWSYTDADGTLLGQRVTALARVGVYVPGGKAAYPSSVLMNTIPAKVAGVPEIIMVVPAPQGTLSDMVLAAAGIAGVDRVFTVGGAQAVAALAYGTATIPKVDKIVGPGNIYVATAKRMVFGIVDIDMIAGPSEIVILCDGKTDPDWIAMDMFSQAEHDEDAQAILISTDDGFTQRVGEAIGRLLPSMERAEVIRKSLESRGALITVRDIDEGVALVNRIAPEHLELSLDDAHEVAAAIQNAGAIFLGRYTPEAMGDYCAGPNHVLPTSGTARFSSPLGVYDFQKRTSVIGCTSASATVLSGVAATLARAEGLTAHARSAEYRSKK